MPNLKADLSNYTTSTIDPQDLVKIIKVNGGNQEAFISFTDLAREVSAGDILDDVVTIGETQTLTNKTLDGAILATGEDFVNVAINPQTHANPILSIRDFGTQYGFMVTETQAQTLTNKTIEDTVKLELPNTAVVNAVAASKVLTVADTPHEGDTVTIGTKTYKARLDALGAGAAATVTLTSDTTEVSDGDTVTIGTTVYRFKDTMAQAYDVKRDGTDADKTLGYLINAINGTGTAGVEYYAGTLAHPDVTAGDLNSHAITITANAIGFAGNAIAIVTPAHIIRSDSYLIGGIDPQAANDVYVNGNAENFINNLEKAVEADPGTIGTDYGTGTTINASAAISAKDASTATVTAKVKGVSGNSIAIAKSGSHLSWAGGATALSGGVDGTVGTAGEIRSDLVNSKIWVCTADNTIADSNWKYASLT